ncbi:NADPH-dependent F420 reductase [Paraburkholderia sp. J41]|uniref:NADPH-dependent F420 reductase n=1 Tax=Paraburkholderia sp. J41 TaxID=2805433 RepID=UPI002AC317A7|nr:NAD(P)-binding domain-containing protein [Paraburkholderia sp. J41]
MQVGIVGAGNVGEALARRLVDAGYRVRVANARGAASLVDFARRTGAEAVNIEDVAASANILILAVPIQRVVDLPKSLFVGRSHSMVVVDTANYVPSLVGTINEIDAGMPESEWVSRQIGVPVVKAFNSMTAYSMAHGGRSKAASDRIAVPVAADDPQARAMIMVLVEQLGFTGFDAGPIAQSWRQQPGQPTYATDPTVVELPGLLNRADRKRAPANRDKAMKLMAKLPADFPVTDLVRVARLSVGLDKLNPRSWLAMVRVGLASL